jgi:hypothetical protein
MSYFYNFPKISYLNKQSRNIILKAALISDVMNKVDAFYPYVIQDYERPDTIAYETYGDENLDWVVYFSNNITDPYYDWPLTNVQLKEYLEKKYNTSIYALQSQIKHYVYTGIAGESAEDIARKSYIMSPTTFAYSPASGWTPKYTYDYEVELNEAKRSIKLLNKFYIPQIKKEIASVFKK